VLDRDPFDGPADEIGHTGVHSTYVAGQRVVRSSISVLRVPGRWRPQSRVPDPYTRADPIAGYVAGHDVDDGDINAPDG
jgi:hypothetical protein